MKNKKIWLFLSLLCLLSGGLFVLLGTLLGGIPGFYLDKRGIHTSEEAANQTMKVFQDTIELDTFDSMELSIYDAEDVTLIPSDRYAVEYRITGIYEKPVCQVEDGRLIFRETSAAYNDPGIWFLYASPRSEYIREPGPYYVKIEYPADQIFTDVRIRMECGDLKLPFMQADTLDIRDDYGDVSLDGFTGTAWTLYMSSGNLTAGSVTAEQTNIVSEYGDVSLEDYIGNALDIRMSSGDLSLGPVTAEQTEIQNEYGTVQIEQMFADSLTANLSSGSFLAGSLDVPALKVVNEYGTVRIRLPGTLSDYGYRLQTEYGSVLLDGKSLANSDEEEDEICYTSAGTNGKTIEILCDSGDIIIDPLP